MQLFRFRTLVVTAALAGLAALALTSSAGAAAPTKLVGTVGPGFTITLKKAARPVRLLTPGRYSITVADKSNIHNFHLKGPGAEQGDHDRRLRRDEDRDPRPEEGHLHVRVRPALHLDEGVVQGRLGNPRRSRRRSVQA